eukprot:151048-Amphidinium_carterae.4
MDGSKRCSWRIIAAVFTFVGCGVGYCTDTGENLDGSAMTKQYVFRAKLLVAVRAREACHPQWLEVTQSLKGVVASVRALQKGHHRPKGRHRQPQAKALAAMTSKDTFDWMKAQQSDRDALYGRVPPKILLLQHDISHMVHAISVDAIAFICSII